MTDTQETFYVAIRSASKSEDMDAVVLRTEQACLDLGKEWTYVLGTERELKDLPMKVLVALVKKGAGSAPKKFENLRDGAKRLYPLLPQLVQATAVKAKIAKAKAPKEPKPKKDPTGLRAIMDKKIKVLVKDNPKRPGTRAYDYFEVVRKYEGKTVSEFLDKARSEPAFKDTPNEVSQELRWNGIKKNFIAFVD